LVSHWGKILILLFGTIVIIRHKTRSFPKKKYYHLFTGSSVLVLALVSALDKENISPVVKDQGESARLAGFGITTPLLQEVFLHEDEIEKGKKVIKQLF
jgi:hypothetical protein